MVLTLTQPTYELPFFGGNPLKMNLNGDERLKRRDMFYSVSSARSLTNHYKTNHVYACSYHLMTFVWGGLDIDRQLWALVRLCAWYGVAFN